VELSALLRMCENNQYATLELKSAEDNECRGFIIVQFSTDKRGGIVTVDPPQCIDRAPELFHPSSDMETDEPPQTPTPETSISVSVKNLARHSRTPNTLSVVKLSQGSIPICSGLESTPTIARPNFSTFDRETSHTARDQSSTHPQQAIVSVASNVAGSDSKSAPSFFAGASAADVRHGTFNAVSGDQHITYNYAEAERQTLQNRFNCLK